ncbi:MAG TPA: bifunctional 3-(3-hydroxy-phenyl)propionate/3-hydroxycinnamic acid hydroxylase [Parvibaculum sp.]
MDKIPQKTDVLIVGLGPVGAVLAVYLGRLGVDVIAIERDKGVYPVPRAAHLDHETMRLLHLAGGAAAVAAASQPLSSYEFRTGSGELLMGFTPGGATAPTGFPASSMFHQPTLEHAVRERLTTIPGVSVRLGQSLAGYEAGGSGVRARIAGEDGEYDVEARFLIGCDGGGSIVRRLSGIALDDMGFDEPWLVIDAVLKDGRKNLSTVGMQYCDPRRPVTSMPMAPGRHRWEFMLRAGETPEEISTDARIDELIAPFADPASVTVERRAVYRFHALRAQSWRKGPVILAGDAAHQMPPFMGQGLCSGVRDAANLGWKLAAVLQGRAADALLDSYQVERSPHVQAITEAAVFMGKVVCTQNADEAAARDRDMTSKAEGERFTDMPGLAGLASGIMAGDPVAGAVFPEPWMAGDGAPKRLDDVAGLAPILVVRRRDEASARFEANGGFVVAVDQLADARGFLAELLGEAEAVLVRPDKHVFGRGTPAALAAAWMRYLATGAVAA